MDKKEKIKIMAEQLKVANIDGKDNYRHAIEEIKLILKEPLPDSKKLSYIEDLLIFSDYYKKTYCRKRTLL